VGLLACAYLTACGTLSKSQLDASDAEKQRYARRGDLQAEVDSLAQPLVTQGITPGLVVGVLLPDGRKKFYGYGIADKETGAKPDGDTVFAIGSLSKGFLGGLAALLVNEGALSWNDPLIKLLPDEKLSESAAQKITPRQLATHTSGLPRQPFPPKTLLYFIAYLFNGNNFYRQFERSYILDYLRDFEPPATPEVIYSNIGYGILGYVLERRSGQSAAALVTQKIIRPLSLTSTGYAFEHLPQGSVRAQGYAGDQPKFIRRGEPVPDWQFNDFLQSSAGMHSSAKDLLTFASAHFKGNNDRLRTALRSTLKPIWPRPARAPAIGWVVDEFPRQKITYQVGFVAGYSSYLGLDVERRIAVAVLQNSFNFNDAVGHRLLNRMAGKKDS